jgi:hypothetical protein
LDLGFTMRYALQFQCKQPDIINASTAVPMYDYRVNPNPVPMHDSLYTTKQQLMFLLSDAITAICLSVVDVVIFLCVFIVNSVVKSIYKSVIAYLYIYWIFAVYILPSMLLQ